jgi:hypothetical protein
VEGEIMTEDYQEAENAGGDRLTAEWRKASVIG